MKHLILALALIGQVTCPGRASAEISVCFTPGEDCAQFIVRQIDTARSELLVLQTSSLAPETHIHCTDRTRCDRRGERLKARNPTGNTPVAVWILHVSMDKLVLPQSPKPERQRCLEQEQVW
jgi:hypothetical protein